MAGPFKMKGSPMQRNFGTGSPLHQSQFKAYKKENKEKQEIRNLKTKEGLNKLTGSIKKGVKTALEIGNVAAKSIAAPVGLALHGADYLLKKK